MMRHLLQTIFKLNLLFISEKNQSYRSELARWKILIYFESKMTYNEEFNHACVDGSTLVRARAHRIINIL